MVLFRSVREYDPQFGKNSSEDEEEGQEEKRDAQRCLVATARVPEGSRGPEGQQHHPASRCPLLKEAREGEDQDWAQGSSTWPGGAVNQ